MRVQICAGTQACVVGIGRVSLWRRAVHVRVPKALCVGRCGHMGVRACVRTFVFAFPFVLWIGLVNQLGFVYGLGIGLVIAIGIGRLTHPHPAPIPHPLCTHTYLGKAREACTRAHHAHAW